MFANFYSGSPVNLANYSNPELDSLLEHARATPTGQAHRGLLRDQPALNKEAIWFWTFQNTYYAIANAKVKGVPQLYSGVIDVSARLDGIARRCSGFVARRLLYLLPVLLAVTLLTFLIASLLPGDLAYVDPGRPGDAGEGRGAARRDGPRSADLAALPALAVGHVLQGDLGRSFRTGETVLPRSPTACRCRSS